MMSSLESVESVSQCKTNSLELTDNHRDSLTSTSTVSSGDIQWDETLDLLSRQLQTICQSVHCTTGSQTPPAATTTRARCNSQLTTGGSLDSAPLVNRPNLISADLIVSQSATVVSSIDGTTATTHSTCRPLRVHHEETSDKLRQSLTKICSSSPTSSQTHLDSESTIDPTVQSLRTNGTPGTTGTLGTTGRSSKSSTAAVRLRESLKSGVRARVDLNSVSCENVIVAVEKKSMLRVYTASEPTVTLYTQSIPTQTQLTALACSITEDGQTLYIRERSKQFMYIETHFAASCREAELIYLPVVQHSEYQLHITLRVNHCFQFEDISVKTVDDRLVISAKQLVYNTEPTAAGDNCSMPTAAAGVFTTVVPATVVPTTAACMCSCSSTRQLMTLILCLPEGTNTRSVKAQMNVGRRQLLISAQSTPASRRMTCNF